MCAVAALAFLHLAVMGAGFAGFDVELDVDRAGFFEGETIAATLTFEMAGTIDVEFNVESGKPGAHHGPMKEGEGGHSAH